MRDNIRWGRFKPKFAAFPNRQQRHRAPIRYFLQENP